MASRSELLRATEATARFYWHQLRDRPDGWAVRHLRERGIGEEILAGESGWWLGYAPDSWTGLVDHLRREGFADEVLLAAGLATATRSGYLIDRFRGRIMFVAEDRDRNPVGFIGRGRRGPVRYLNSPSTSIYTKANALLGVNAQLRRLSDGALPVLGEGTMDALAVSQLGARWAGISPCGTTVSREQAMMLRRASKVDTVIVAFDGNPAGRLGAARSLDALSSAFGVVMVAELPSDHDPSSLFAADRGRLRGVLSRTRPLAQFAIDVELARWARVLDHVSGQVNAVRAVAPLVARMPPGLVAGEITRLSRKVGLEEHIVSREVVAAVGLRREQLATRRRMGRRVRSLEAGADPPETSRTP
ncbi:toprim domain-containing protein [Kribbella sp. NPDC050820]|uniref:toprim domain-containing protein n=1 Tax=Kribbella sp. NPDC050820 TaxID=3155408 RepID=UPI0033E9267F